jgi:hypothetical protein
MEQTKNFWSRINIRSVIKSAVTYLFSVIAISWTVFALLLSLIGSLVFWIGFYWDRSFLKLNFSLYLFSMFAKIGLYPIGFLYKHFIPFFSVLKIKLKSCQSITVQRLTLMTKQVMFTCLNSLTIR